MYIYLCITLRWVKPSLSGERRSKVSLHRLAWRCDLGGSNLSKYRDYQRRTSKAQNFVILVTSAASTWTSNEWTPLNLCGYKIEFWAERKWPNICAQSSPWRVMRITGPLFSSRGEMEPGRGGAEAQVSLRRPFGWWKTLVGEKCCGELGHDAELEVLLAAVKPCVWIICSQLRPKVWNLPQIKAQSAAGALTRVWHTFSYTLHLWPFCSYNCGTLQGQGQQVSFESRKVSHRQIWWNPEQVFLIRLKKKRQRESPKLSNSHTWILHK